jgi:hypothetical protein
MSRHNILFALAVCFIGTVATVYYFVGQEENSLTVKNTEVVRPIISISDNKDIHINNSLKTIFIKEDVEKDKSYNILKNFMMSENGVVNINISITNCNNCLQLIKQELSNNNNLSIEKVDILLSALQENNEVANLLIESVILRIKQQGNIVDTNSAKTMSKIASFTTLEAAKISIENIKNNNLPIELKNTLIEQIDNTKDRAAIADYLMTTFKDEKSFLIEIAHPETLALLFNKNDEEFNAFIEEPLVENGSKYTAIVFLDLFKKANNNSEKQEKIINMAQQWASNQLSGSRIDFIEENLSKNLFSSEDKILIEKILNNAEDQSKSAYLLQKYFVPTL